MSQPFTRRMYRRPAQLFEDVRTVLSARGQIRALMQGQTISAAFPERLMLAVSGVNVSRYCSFVHAQQALKAGLSDPEVRALCAGSLGGCPEEELPALLFSWTSSAVIRCGRSRVAGPGSSTIGSCPALTT